MNGTIRTPSILPTVLLHVFFMCAPFALDAPCGVLFRQGGKGGQEVQPHGAPSRCTFAGCLTPEHVTAVQLQIEEDAKGLLRGAAPVIRGVRIILGPLAHGLVALGTRITPGASRGASFASEEQLLSIIDEAAENELIEQDDRELIHSVFDFTDSFVRAVMVPRTDMVTVDATASTREAMSIFLDKGISRIPIVDDEADDVVGVLYLKDLVQFGFRDESGWRDAPVTRSGSARAS